MCNIRAFWWWRNQEDCCYGNSSDVRHRILAYLSSSIRNTHCQLLLGPCISLSLLPLICCLFLSSTPWTLLTISHTLHTASPPIAQHRLQVCVHNHISKALPRTLSIRTLPVKDLPPTLSFNPSLGPIVTFIVRRYSCCAWRVCVLLFWYTIFVLITFNSQHTQRSVRVPLKSE